MALKTTYLQFYGDSLGSVVSTAEAPWYPTCDWPLIPVSRSLAESSWAIQEVDVAAWPVKALWIFFFLLFI